MTPAGEFQFEMGIEAIRQGRLAEAEKWFTRALQVQPGWHEALQRRAYVREMRGQLPAAARDYRFSLLEAPDCIWCFEGAADVAVKRGRWREAEGYLDQALHLESSNTSILYDRGCVRLKRGRLREATEDFSRVAAFCREGRSMIALVGRAQARALMGDFEPALEDLDRAVRMRSGVREHHFIRGIVRFLSKDTKASHEDFRKAGVSPKRIQRITKSRRHLRMLLKVSL